MAEDTTDDERSGPEAWREFLSQEPLYQNLRKLRREGWSSSAGDTFFQKRRAAATNANRKTRESFFTMTQDIARRIVSATGVYNLKNPTPDVLDLCMAPGGFSAMARKMIPRSRIDAITLPTKLGGHRVMRPDMFRELLYADITMFASEMGVERDEIPHGHPDLKNFEPRRPFLDRQYDLIFCGGAVVKEHTRQEYRSSCEASRLTLSQLVFALARVKPGGSLVLLLYRVESWSTVCFLHVLSKFAEIQLFKPSKQHAIKSSFYLVARNINLSGPAVGDALPYWKERWKYSTFKDFDDTLEPPVKLAHTETDDYVHEVIAEFGPHFLEMTRPLWEIQASALRRSCFIQSPAVQSN